MPVSRIDKAKIVKVYLEKSISNKEVEFLLNQGKAIAPSEWVYYNEGEREKQEQKRELISRVFGHSFPKIEWVCTLQ